MGLLGILVALGLLIWLAYRGWSTKLKRLGPLTINTLARDMVMDRK